MGRSPVLTPLLPPFWPPPGLTDILWHPAIPGVRTPTRCPSLPQAGFHPAPRHRLPRSRVSVARLLRLFRLPVRKVGLSLPRGLCSCCPRSCPSSPRPPAPVESPPRLTSELHGDPLASPTRSRPLATGPWCSPCSRFRAALLPAATVPCIDSCLPCRTRSSTRGGTRLVCFVWSTAFSSAPDSYSRC